MKKATIELYRQSDCYTGYGIVPWIYTKMDFDEKVMEWANKNNAFIYSHKVIERHEQYEPVKLKYLDIANKEVPVGDQIIELVIYYYDLKEVPSAYKALQELKDKINAYEKNTLEREWSERCNQN